jgi:hypothetical protein
VAGTRHALRTWALRVRAWWTLGNVNTVAQLAFGLTGTVAALAAVNFFIFSPRVPTPAVTRAVVIDDSTVRLEYQGSLPPVVARVESDYSTAAALSSRGTYDAGPALVKDCVLYQRDIELLVPKACGSVAMTGVDYPPYIHELITMEGTFDPAAFLKYLADLAESRLATPHPGSAQAAVPAPPPEQHALSDEQLEFAYTALRNAAVPVDVVSVVNSGHADATNVQIAAPADMQPYSASDRGAFDLAAGQTRTRLYRRAASSGGLNALTSAESLPVEGFEVASSSSDSLVSQELARVLLAICLIVVFATVVRDVHRTRPASAPQ